MIFKYTKNLSSGTLWKKTKPNLQDLYFWHELKPKHVGNL